MRTLYLRNVPDDVAERLEERARAERLSLNAFAVRELAEIARRSTRDNATLVADLPSHPVPTDRVVTAVHEGRR